MHTQGEIDHMAGMATNLLAHNGMRIFRCDFDGDFDSPEAVSNAERLKVIWNNWDLMLQCVGDLLACVDQIDTQHPQEMWKGWEYKNAKDLLEQVRQ